MNKDELKTMGCTSIEDLITEDFGALLGVFFCSNILKVEA